MNIKKAKEQTIEFCKKHQTGLKRAGLMAVGASIASGVAIGYAKYLDKSPKAFLKDPVKLSDGRYSVGYGRISKLGRTNSGGNMIFEKDQIRAICHDFLKITGEQIEGKCKCEM